MIPITKDMMIDTYATREGINELLQEIAQLKSERQELIDFINNDALAISYQSMGQYRTELLKRLRRGE